MLLLWSTASFKLVGELTDSERELVDAVTSGRPFVVEGDAAGRTVHGEVVAELIKGGFGPLHQSGIRIEGSVILGDLSLVDLTVKAPIQLVSVVVQGSIDVSRAVLRRLSLRECSLETLRGEDLRLSTTLELTETVAKQTVELRAATIDGDVRVDGLRIEGADDRGYGLDLSNAQILGNLAATGLPLDCPSGGVRMSHARVAGLVELLGSSDTCIGGCNARGFAVEAVSLRVEGSADLSRVRFTGGGVRLLQAAIGGALILRGSTLRPSNDGLSFHGEGIELGGNALLDGGFETCGGALAFTRASIGGDLLLDAALLDAASEAPAPLGDVIALNLEGSKIGGRVSLSRGPTRVDDKVTVRDFVAHGTVLLSATEIADQLDCSGGKFHSADSDCDAILADRVKVGAEVLMNDGFEAHGEVRLAAADIGRTLDLRHGHFLNPGGTAFHGNGMSVGGQWIMRPDRLEGGSSASRARPSGRSTTTSTPGPNDGWATASRSSTSARTMRGPQRPRPANGSNGRRSEAGASGHRTTRPWRRSTNDEGNLRRPAPSSSPENVTAPTRPTAWCGLPTGSGERSAATGIDHTEPSGDSRPSSSHRAQYSRSPTCNRPPTSHRDSGQRSTHSTSPSRSPTSGSRTAISRSTDGHKE